MYIKLIKKLMLFLKIKNYFHYFILYFIGFYFQQKMQINLKFYLVLNSQYYYKDLFNFNKSSYFNLILCFSQTIFEEYVILFLIYLLTELSSEFFN